MKHQVAVWPENLILVGGVLIYVIWWKVIQSKHRVGCGTTEMSTQWLFGSDQFIQIVTISVLDTTGKASRTCLPAFHWKWCVLPHIWNHPNLVGRCWISPSQKYIWYNHPKPVRPKTMCHFAHFHRIEFPDIYLIQIRTTIKHVWNNILVVQFRISERSKTTERVGHTWKAIVKHQAFWWFILDTLPSIDVHWWKIWEWFYYSSTNIHVVHPITRKRLLLKKSPLGMVSWVSRLTGVPLQ